MDRARLEQVMSFPGPFTFRIVADERAGLGETCVAAAEAALGRAVERIEELPSPSGRYRTVRLAVTVADADEVLRAYAALGALPGLRMLL